MIAFYKLLMLSLGGFAGQNAAGCTIRAHDCADYEVSQNFSREIGNASEAFLNPNFPKAINGSAFQQFKSNAQLTNLGVEDLKLLCIKSESKGTEVLAVSKMLNKLSYLLNFISFSKNKTLDAQCQNLQSITGFNKSCVVENCCPKTCPTCPVYTTSFHSSSTKRSKTTAPIVTNTTVFSTTKNLVEEKTCAPQQCQECSSTLFHILTVFLSVPVASAITYFCTKNRVEYNLRHQQQH